MTDAQLVKAIDRLTTAVERLTAVIVGGEQAPPDDPCVRCRGRREWAPGVPCEACGGSGRANGGT